MNRMNRWPALAMMLFSLILSAGTSRAAPPEVVVSIKPIHALVSGVMQGVGKPHLLLSGSESPHSYALRPSEAARLRRADMVFWIGEELENFLVKPLATLSKNARVVELHTVEGMRLLKNREGGTWEPHEEHDRHEDDHDDHHHGEHDEHADDHDDHHHGEMDMHVWLDPANARAMVFAISHTLGEIDPGNRNRYAKNATRMNDRLSHLQENLAARLAPIRQTAYIVFHDAYHYFENRFGLNAVGSITVNPERKPGARRLLEIREKIVRSDAACIFSEPQFEPALVDAVARGTRARKGSLDPMGVRLKPGEAAYFQLLENLAADLTACLQKP